MMMIMNRLFKNSQKNIGSYIVSASFDKTIKFWGIGKMGTWDYIASLPQSENPIADVDIDQSIYYHHSFISLSLFIIILQRDKHFSTRNTDAMTIKPQNRFEQAGVVLAADVEVVDEPKEQQGVPLRASRGAFPPRARDAQRGEDGERRRER